MQQREVERQEIMQQYQGFYRITAVLLFIGIGIFIGWMLFADKEGYGMNLWTELAGVAFTFLILDWWTWQRDERRDQAILKRRLIREMGSSDNTTTLNAIRELRDYGWLEDGTLQGINLRGSNLARAKLRKSDLREANLQSANLEGADLLDINLEHSNLINANLKLTQLSGAKLGCVDISAHPNQRADKVEESSI